MPRLKMKWVAGAAAAIAVMSLASAAGAATLTSTGVLGVGSPELNWVVVSSPGSTTLTGVSGAADYPGAWVVAPSGSNWVTPYAATGTTATDAPLGTYHYQLSFPDPLASVAIEWSSDNGATFSLNGGATLSTIGSNGFSSLVPFLIPAGSFQAGPNFFDVFVQNDFCDGCLNPTGLLVSVSVSATPLPAALPLFATGLGAFGVLGWRRKKKTAALAA